MIYRFNSNIEVKKTFYTKHSTAYEHIHQGKLLDVLQYISTYPSIIAINGPWYPLSNKM